MQFQETSPRAPDEDDRGVMGQDLDSLFPGTIVLSCLV